MDDSNIVGQLRSFGLAVDDAGQGPDVFMVSRGGDSAVLDLTSEEAMHDSLATIKATFGLDPSVNHNRDGFPLMSQTMTGGKLAQKVASIGEVKAAVMHRGVTRHYDVCLTEGQVSVGDDSWPVKAFMAQAGPLSMRNKQEWINADEFRDVLGGFHAE